MPWSVQTPMSERQDFVEDALRGLYSMTDVCARYGVSRRVGYKWLDRFLREGPAGLADRPRRPHTLPRQLGAELRELLLATRRAHPTWGPRKILAYLARRHRRGAWPAASTVGALFQAAGLIRSRPRRRPLGHPGRPTTPMDAPNAVWTADFKGQFRTRDGAYCYPLTVADGYSRYLLACHALPGATHAATRPVFERLFREYGLPERIRTDNGVPFATAALCRLSSLSVWWLKLGIQPELIEPSHPEQNGRHERMHKTLKAETTRPPAGTRRAQQRRFSAFRHEYNEERPHQALGNATPASCYKPSPRPLPARLPAVEYPGHFRVYYVSRNGGIRFGNRWVNLTHVLIEEFVGLEEVDDGVWNVYFGSFLLGRFDERDRHIHGFHNRNKIGNQNARRST
jgi:putative transposase